MESVNLAVYSQHEPMTTALTSGISISVDCRFEDKFSNPTNKLFIFSYGILIENKNPFPIQLLRRYWSIVDSNMAEREVNGDGVVGEQPIINPGESYSYRSSCDFNTDTGKMSGYYIMRNLENEKLLKVAIPEFLLIVPYRLN